MRAGTAATHERLLSIKQQLERLIESPEAISLDDLPPERHSALEARVTRDARRSGCINGCIVCCRPNRNSTRGWIWVGWSCLIVYFVVQLLVFATDSSTGTTDAIQNVHMWQVVIGAAIVGYQVKYAYNANTQLRNGGWHREHLFTPMLLCIIMTVLYFLSLFGILFSASKNMNFIKFFWDKQPSTYFELEVLLSVVTCLIWLCTLSVGWALAKLHTCAFLELRDSGPSFQEYPAESSCFTAALCRSEPSRHTLAPLAAWLTYLVLGGFVCSSVAMVRLRDDRCDVYATVPVVLMAILLKGLCDYSVTISTRGQTRLNAAWHRHRVVYPLRVVLLFLILCLMSVTQLAAHSTDVAWCERSISKSLSTQEQVFGVLSTLSWMSILFILHHTTRLHLFCLRDLDGYDPEDVNEDHEELVENNDEPEPHARLSHSSELVEEAHIDLPGSAQDVVPPEDAGPPEMDSVHDVEVMEVQDASQNEQAEIDAHQHSG